MMISNYVTVLDRELHYTEWGAGNRETVVMWHGLAPVSYTHLTLPTNREV